MQRNPGPFRFGPRRFAQLRLGPLGFGDCARTLTIRESIRILLLLAVIPSTSLALSGGTYDLNWNTFDGGGKTFAAGGTYSLGGTMGQPDAGALQNGPHLLAGGFWQGLMSTSGVEPGLLPPPVLPSAPLAFRLYPAAPNPARLITRVAFDMPAAGPVRLAAYNLLGARVRTLVDQPVAAGHHLVSWNGLDESGNRVGSGVFYLRLESGSRRAQEKLIVLQ